MKLLYVIFFCFFLSITFLNAGQFDSLKIKECDNLIDKLLESPTNYIDLVNEYHKSANYINKIDIIPSLDVEIFHSPYTINIKYDSLVLKSKDFKKWCSDFKKSNDSITVVYYSKYMFAIYINEVKELIVMEYQFYFVDDKWIFKGVNHSNKWHCAE